MVSLKILSFPYDWRMDVLISVIPSTFMEEVGTGQIPVFTAFIKKSKSFPAITYIFLLYVIVQNCVPGSWENRPYNGAGKEEGLGELMLGRPVNGVYYRCH